MLEQSSLYFHFPLDSPSSPIMVLEGCRALIPFQGVGSGIAELSAGFSLALEMGARLEDIAATIHAHPTRSEGLLEAALKAMGNPIHI